MAGGVAGAVEHLEAGLAELQHITVVQPAIWGEAARALHAPVGGRRLDLVDPELVVLVRAFDGQSGAFAQIGRAATVIQVPVGDPDLLQRQPARAHQLDQPLGLGPGIDDRRLVGPGAPDQGAVLPKRRHRHDQGADRWKVGSGVVQVGSGAGLRAGLPNNRSGADIRNRGRVGGEAFQVIAGLPRHG